ncbi:MAG: BlaI/MecI/CopY family transcriptional regulator [Chloroflexota bacterium]|nr:BlaI/MecI/CopY family transcriptional regulator [Chloroflexota bacterium]
MSTSQEIKFRFNPSSERSSKVLGPLEDDIMEVVWSQGSATVSAVHKALREKKDIAYTTVMTTMSRLAKKHLLNQDTTSSSYVYTPTLSRGDFERYVVNGVVNGLFEDFGDEVIDYFLDAVRHRGDGSMEKLKAAIG